MIDSEHTKHEQLRLSDDKVDDDFYRWEIDRDSMLMNGDFYKVDGIGPYSFAKHVLDHEGEVAILDVGCGTGRALYDMREGLLRYAQGDESKITAVGINDRDYSQESELFAVRKANTDKEQEYVVSSIEEVNLPSESFDIAYCYEVLIHSQTPEALASEIFDKIKSGGAFYFNVDKAQDNTDSFQAFISEIKKTIGVMSYKDKRGEKSRVFYRFVK